jgi:uncharacterized protein YjbI with pentapeptide repeats
VLANAEIRESDLSGANLAGADLKGARCDKVNFEEANIAGANLSEAELKESNAQGANFMNAILEGASMEGSNFENANFQGADLRFVELKKSSLKGAKLTGAKLFGIEVAADQLREISADWIDFSAEGNGSVRLSHAQLLEHFRSAKSGIAGLAGSVVDGAPRRLFGKGDVIKNATLEFGEASIVEVDGRLEKCAITLRTGATLRLGPEGVMEACKIVGDGDIIVHGTFTENGEAGIVGPRRFTVGKTGAVTATVQQPPSMTQFVFEKGCYLRMKILRSK